MFPDDGPDIRLTVVAKNDHPIEGHNPIAALRTIYLDAERKNHDTTFDQSAAIRSFFRVYHLEPYYVYVLGGIGGFAVLI